MLQQVMQDTIENLKQKVEELEVKKDQLCVEREDLEMKVDTGRTQLQQQQTALDTARLVSFLH